MNILEWIPSSFHALGDYVLIAALGAAALFAIWHSSSGGARAGALAGMSMALLLALYWMHARHTWTEALIAKSDAKVAAALDDVKKRDEAIAVHQREVASLQSKIAAVEGEAQKDAEAARVVGGKLDAQIAKEKALDKQITSRERRLRAE